MKNSKFNVGKDTTDRTYKGITFDSVLEMRYYLEVVLPKYESKEIKYYERQKKYILQPGYTLNGKKVLPIIYKADFYIEYSDGRIEVIDTKGFPDAVAKLKKKMFGYAFPGIDYKWICFVKKYGGWLEYDECQRLRKESKKSARKK